MKLLGFKFQIWVSPLFTVIQVDLFLLKYCLWFGNLLTVLDRSNRMGVKMIILKFFFES